MAVPIAWLEVGSPFQQQVRILPTAPNANSTDGTASRSARSRPHLTRGYEMNEVKELPEELLEQVSVLAPGNNERVGEMV